MCEDNCELSNSGCRPNELEEDEYDGGAKQEQVLVPPPKNLTVRIKLTNVDNEILSFRGEHTAIMSVIQALKTRELEICTKEVEVQAQKWKLLGCSSVVFAIGILCFGATKLMQGEFFCSERSNMYFRSCSLSTC